MTKHQREAEQRVTYRNVEELAAGLIRVLAGQENLAARGSLTRQWMCAAFRRGLMYGRESQRRRLQGSQR